MTTGRGEATVRRMVAAGLVALAAALLAALYAASATATARRLAGASAVTCASLTPSSGRVGICGRVEAGSHGLLKAPLSGAACVWYRAVVTERWTELDRAFVRDIDRDGYLDRSEAEAATREQRRTDTDVSAHPFVLRDATGSILVDVRGMTPDRLTRSVHSIAGPPAQGYFPDNMVPIERAGFGVGRASGRGPSRFDREETVLVPGQEVYVRGVVAAHPGGRLGLGGSGLVVSSRGPDELKMEHAARARLAQFAALVAAVAGVALIVAGG